MIAIVFLLLNIADVVCYFRAPNSLRLRLSRRQQIIPGSGLWLAIQARRQS